MSNSGYSAKKPIKIQFRVSKKVEERLITARPDLSIGITAREYLEWLLVLWPSEKKENIFTDSEQALLTETRKYFCSYDEWQASGQWKGILRIAERKGLLEKYSVDKGKLEKKLTNLNIYQTLELIEKLFKKE